MDRKYFRNLIFIFLLFGFTQVEAQTYCRDLLKRTRSNVREKFVNFKAIEILESKDPDGSPLRRLKILTDGTRDMGDPSIPRRIVLPNGQIVWRIYFSGQRYLEAKSVEEFLRGGHFEMHEIIVQYADGTRVGQDDYHTGSSVWDGERIQIHKTDRWGRPYILDRAFAGMMEQPGRGRVPDISSNPTRSRHAFDVKSVWDPRQNKYIEVWTDLGPIHGNRTLGQKDWIVRKGRTPTHHHGYGSRLIMFDRDTPFQDAEGRYWVTYERVTEDSLGRPYRTELFARALNEDLTQAVGPEVSILNTRPVSKKALTADQRKDLSETNRGSHAGYLVEGPNPILLTVGREKFWVISYSAGNYVADTYGLHLAYRTEAQGPIGPYTPVVSSRGKLINFTKELGEKYQLTWGTPGRVNLFYDDQGQLWGLGHGIPKSKLPDHFIKSGWPRPEDFTQYFRQGMLIPFTAEVRNGVPHLRVVDTTPLVVAEPE